MFYYKHLAVGMLAPLQGLKAFLRRQKKQRKNCMLLWHGCRSPILQNWHMNQEVKQELSGKVLSFLQNKLNDIARFICFYRHLEFLLDKFWSTMFKYITGVFPHANIMYHTSLKCLALILVSKYLFNRFLNTTTKAQRWFSKWRQQIIKSK